MPRFIQIGGIVHTEYDDGNVEAIIMLENGPLPTTIWGADLPHGKHTRKGNGCLCGRNDTENEEEVIDKATEFKMPVQKALSNLRGQDRQIHVLNVEEEVLSREDEEVAFYQTLETQFNRAGKESNAEEASKAPETHEFLSREEEEAALYRVLEARYNPTEKDLDAEENEAPRKVKACSSRRNDDDAKTGGNVAIQRPRDIDYHMRVAGYIVSENNLKYLDDELGAH
jgi:hypothetical protein